MRVRVRLCVCVCVCVCACLRACGVRSRARDSSAEGPDAVSGRAWAQVEFFTGPRAIKDANLVVAGGSTSGAVDGIGQVGFRIED